MGTKINPANLQPLQPLFTVEHDCQQPTERERSCTRMVGLCLHHSLPLKLKRLSRNSGEEFKTKVTVIAKFHRMNL